MQHQLMHLILKIPCLVVYCQTPKTELKTGQNKRQYVKSSLCKLLCLKQPNNKRV